MHAAPRAAGRERDRPGRKGVIGRFVHRLAAMGLAIGLAVVGGPARAASIDTTIPYVIMIDHATGNVLYEKKADDRFAPASVAKIMTAAVVFERVKAGQLTLEQTFPISVHAWRTGGAPSRTSTMFAPVNSQVAVGDLLRGLIIHSANDGAIALAEGVAGSEDQFAALMNDKAKQLGLKASEFGNPTGLPHPKQLVTARDLAALARHVIADYPDYFAIYGTREFTFNSIRQQNRNPLLGDFAGADGMKTGYIRESGYNLVATAKRDDTRLILVVAGAKDPKEREAEAKKLLAWGFETFELVPLVADGAVAFDVPVYGGTAPKVAGVAPAGVKVFVAKGSREKLAAKLVYQGPLQAPIAKGQTLGAIDVYLDDRKIGTAPVIAGDDVARGDIVSRARDAIGQLLLGWL
jgi:D-alanyl-D-alanine carboxypeptidase (penicillin-binding protein 5/6)